MAQRVWILEECTSERFRIVFCANGRVANEWIRHYFAAVWDPRQTQNG